MRDLDNERELTVKAILDLNDRIRIVESKFNERGEEDTWRLWMDLRKLLVLGDTANGGKKKEQKGCGKVFEWKKGFFIKCGDYKEKMYLCQKCKENAPKEKTNGN